MAHQAANNCPFTQKCTPPLTLLSLLPRPRCNPQCLLLVLQHCSQALWLLADVLEGCYEVAVM